MTQPWFLIPREDRRFCRGDVCVCVCVRVDICIVFVCVFMMSARFLNDVVLSMFPDDEALAATEPTSACSSCFCYVFCALLS